MRRPGRERRGDERPYVRVLWRLFVPNAVVLGAAGGVLVVAPANGRPIVLAAGVAVMLAFNLLITRAAVAPLSRLIALTRRVDPLAPGERLEVGAHSRSEVTELAEAFNAMLERLEAERRESARRTLSAQERERRLLAAELHDEIGQSLTALLLGLRRGADGAADAEALLGAAAQVDDIIDQVRAVVRRLRPEALDDLGLASALEALCDRMSESSGLRISRHLQRDLDAHLDADSQLVLYRVTQESLTNVVRHAQASHAEVALERTNGAVSLTVVDDGRGLGTVSPRFDGGVRGMRERALLVGAKLTVEPAAPRGVRVTLRVPTSAL